MYAGQDGVDGGAGGAGGDGVEGARDVHSRGHLAHEPGSFDAGACCYQLRRLDIHSLLRQMHFGLLEEKR